MKRKRENSILVPQKIARIMKFTTLLLLTGILHLSAGTYAQSRRISVTVTNGTFYDVITQIEKQSEFMFFYNSDEIDNNSNISIKVKNKLVTEVLNEVIRNRDIHYKIDGKHIIISKAAQQAKRMV
ncbi:MAG: STN domain-containing protein, partial [Tannerella sp.]|nr:STN domain-containing protein [Tannerella sp.]